MEWLQAISQSSVAQALIGSPTLYLLVNAAHVFAIGCLVGPIVVLDLRILGLFATLPLAPAADTLSRVAAIGLCVAIMTGALLFSVRPGEYITNPAFLTKLALLSLGIANVLVVHRSSAWKSISSGGSPTPFLKVTAILSLVVWMAAVIAGRWIGFV